MQDRRSRVAVGEHLRRLRTVVSCFTHAHLGTGTPRRSTGQAPIYHASLVQGSNRFVPVASPVPSAVRIEQSFAIRFPSERATVPVVAVTGCHYGIAQPNGTELLTFQWHPDDISEFFRDPHVHIGAYVARPDVLIAPKDVHKIHIATGHVSLPMFVRMLIEEFGVEPLHADWDARLRAIAAELTEG